MSYGDENCGRGATAKTAPLVGGSSRRISIDSEPSKTDNVVRRQSQIMSAYERLNSLVSVVNQEVDALEKRLVPALRPEPVKDDGAEKLKTDEPLCDLANALVNANERLANAIRRLQNINARVEL